MSPRVTRTRVPAEYLSSLSDPGSSSTASKGRPSRARCRVKAPRPAAHSTIGPGRAETSVATRRATFASTSRFCPSSCGPGWVRDEDMRVGSVIPWERGRGRRLLGGGKPTTQNPPDPEIGVGEAAEAELRLPGRRQRAERSLIEAYTMASEDSEQTPSSLVATAAAERFGVRAARRATARDCGAKADRRGGQKQSSHRDPRCG